MSAVEPIDWVQRLRGRIYSQYVESNWALPLATFIGQQTQQLDDVGMAALYLFSIEPITNDPTSPAYGIGRGARLTSIGALLGQPRGSFSDDVYRLILRAKILTDKSHGEPNRLLAMLRVIYPGATLGYLPGWIAAFTLSVTGIAVDPLGVGPVATLLGNATQAGVYGVLEYQTTPDAVCLICDSLDPAQTCGNELDPTVGGALAGAVSLT